MSARRSAQGYPTGAPREHGVGQPALRVAIRLPLDRFALDLRFEAHHQVTGVFGPSGSGKTSLLEAIAGLRRAARGTIHWGGVCWLDRDAGICRPVEERGIGYVPQDGLLFPHLDVEHNLLAGGRRARRQGRDTGAVLREVLALLELEPFRHRAVATLSGGERQRVALGRALCSGPSLLLLDEPFAALDRPLRRRLLGFLGRVRREIRIPMLLVSHDPIEVQALCDDLIVLDAGTISGHGPPRDVLTDAAVFPVADEQGFETVLRGRVEQREADAGILVLHGTSIRLVTAALPERLDEEVLVSIPARDVVVATERPHNVSARNILEATIEDIHAAGSTRLVHARLASVMPPIVIEITEATRHRLALETGKSVFLMIKANACQVLAG